MAIEIDGEQVDTCGNPDTLEGIIVIEHAWHDAFERQLCDYSKAEKMHLSRFVHLGHRTVLIHTFDIRVIVLTIQFLPGLLLPLLYGW